ncbi:MAG: hypothetical protein ABEH88_11075 [Halobacteriales archaeon]
MTERIRSDGVETIRATVERSGGTRRPEIRLPTGRADDLPEGPIRVTIDGTGYHAPVVSGPGGTTLRGAYANARRARERDGTDHLAAWIDDREIGFGRSVLLDIVVPGEQYGLRAPGEDAVYSVQRGLSTELQEIARDLERT